MPHTLRAIPVIDEPEEAPLTTLQERKQQLVRDVIWRAATDLFSEKGYEETTIEEIAEKAGVSRRSFFRYFDTKSDLIAHGTLNYGRSIVAVLDSFPLNYPLTRTFRETVLSVVQQSVSNPETRKVMQIAAKYPAVRAVQFTKLVEVHDRVAVAYARRANAVSPSSRLTPSILAGLTVSILSVTFRIWFEQGQKDITSAAEEVLATLGQVV